MAADGNIRLSKEDEAILSRFAHEMGVESGTLLSMVAHAVAEHIRKNGFITFPITITASVLPQEARGGEPRILTFELPKNSG